MLKLAALFGLLAVAVAYPAEYGHMYRPNSAFQRHVGYPFNKYFQPYQHYQPYFNQNNDYHPYFNHPRQYLPYINQPYQAYHMPTGYPFYFPLPKGLYPYNTFPYYRYDSESLVNLNSWDVDVNTDDHGHVSGGVHYHGGDD